MTFITKGNIYLKCPHRPDIINNQDVQALEIETHCIAPIMFLNMDNEHFQESILQPHTNNQYTIEQTLTDCPPNKTHSSWRLQCTSPHVGLSDKELKAPHTPGTNLA